METWLSIARRHNIRLIVKASGHDYIGRSVAPNSLSIWTRHIQGFKAHTTFSPQRCCGVTINQTAATLGAGTQMYEAYTQLDALGQAMVGGGGKTVGVGGYLTGGGHGLLSAQHGLGADQVLELEVVTPTGKIVVANECQNTDLFWAMRGVSAMNKFSLLPPEKRRNINAQSKLTHYALSHRAVVRPSAS